MMTGKREELENMRACLAFIRASMANLMPLSSESARLMDAVSSYPEAMQTSGFAYDGYVDEDSFATEKKNTR